VPRPFRYTEEEVRAAVAAARSYSDVLRILGVRAAGGNHRTIRKYVDEVWRIPTDHFDAHAARLRGLRLTRIPLHEVMVEGSSYSRSNLKARLLEEGIKARRCELCGQGETWHGRRMALVLDHINGVHDDHRLENLRILCPNCNATLDTHCGRHNRRRHANRTCPVCAIVFRPSNAGQTHCSTRCGSRSAASRRAQQAQRRTPRPPYVDLLHDIAELGYLGAGRKYGVSDNAIRKWRRAYEDDAAASADSRGATGDVYPAAGG
jgi:hypothetical protein